ncbi:cytochrome c biogenesis protein CcdA [Prosthecobacter sp.]|uniref:cytochrome c biogenesis protein CcdA n=1 Tax=Prosthecobacter sp. TaxID=1965333 RepID=UPI0037849A63
MRCCIKIAAWLLLAGLFAQAQNGPVLDAGPPRVHIDPSELNPKLRAAAATLDAMREDGLKPTPEQWAVVCEACGLHVSLRSYASMVKPFPSEITVGLLTHPMFAVRMGALEILEERTNQDSLFDPWAPEDPKSQEALKLWQAWATGKTPAEAQAVPAFDEARMRVYLVDVVGNDVGKQERAFEAMAKSGMQSVKFLEQYLHDTPQLSDGVRAKVKQAQYRLVMADNLPKDAQRIARDLVFGTRDQKLAAMQPLTRCREKAVPMLAEFLPHEDALIREAAMDALIVAGEEAVYDLVQERLKVETDQNVIHAVLRRVSTKSDRGAALIASFMTSKNEDLLVASLNALSDGRSKAGKEGVRACLSDPRWRVRVAALEYVGKLKISSAGDAVIAGFSDKDEFVRYASMKAAADMNLSNAVPLITKMALSDDTLLGPATDAIVRMGRLLPDELVDALPSKSGESLLGVLRAFGQQAGHDGEHIDLSRAHKSSGGSFGGDRGHDTASQALGIIRTLSTHKDPDVRALAVHLLAGFMLEDEDKKRVFEALKQADADGKIAILESIRPGNFNFMDSQADAETENADASAPAVEENDVFSQVLREPPPRNHAQEAVYAAFGVPVAAPPGSPKAAVANASSPQDREWRPMEKEFRDLFQEEMRSKDNPELMFNAALQLACGGQRRAIEELLRLLSKLEPHQRARLASSLGAFRLSSNKSGSALLRTMLQDESPEVRVDVVEAVLRADTSDRLKMLLEELGRPDGNLKAVDVYNYTLANATEKPVMRSAMQAWSTEMLSQPQGRDDAKTLALVLLGTISKQENKPLVDAALTAPNVWQRRAAWRALLQLDRDDFAAKAAMLAGDSSPLVREVLAAAYQKSNRSNDNWRVWFGERDFEEETMPYRQRSKVYAIPDEVAPQLAKLSHDPEPEVKLPAMLTLLSHGQNVEPLALREAVAGLSDNNERRRYLEPFLESSYRSLSPQYGFLLDQVERQWFGEDDWKAMNAFMNPGAQKKSGKALTSFASLVQTGAAATVAVKDAVPAVAAVAAPVSQTGPVRVLFFYKPGCKDCERIRDMLRTIHEAQPLALEEHNVELSDGAERNEALCVRFKVTPELHQVTPAVFTQAGALVKTAVTYNALQRLIEKTTELPPDDSWYRVEDSERSKAGEEIAQRYDRFSIGWVALAGLLDGINPCAFATIIFFLSYLRIARRSPREILMVGAAFILAVFIAYFAVGLGLSQLVSKLTAFAWVRIWLNRLLALVALVLAWLSFRDGLRAWRGRIGDATLQLPEFLKTRIRGVIRTQTKSSRFVIAAFVSGIVISLLELACTGQVYLPTIIYMMKQGSLGAVAYLLLYNVAFVLPLIAIFILAWLGMTSDALIEFQKRHTVTVRFLTALLFLALWIVLLMA